MMVSRAPLLSSRTRLAGVASALCIGGLLFGCEQDRIVAGVLDEGVRTPPSSWGAFAAELDVPPCRTERVLTVDTSAEELDGGEAVMTRGAAGARLSFTEALWIAANNAGPTTITFDPAVFPVDDPATILVSEAYRMPRNGLDGLCLDGRGRGVIVDWDCVVCDPSLMWRLGSGALQVGMTLLRMPHEVTLVDAQVAGCRLSTDGLELHPGARPWVVTASRNSVIGPGNVFAARSSAVRTLFFEYSTQVLVKDNYFGFDPLTQAILPVLDAFDLRSRTLIIGNVMAVTGEIIDPMDAGEAELRDNYIGVDDLGRALVGDYVGLDLTRGASYVVGPGNVIRGVRGPAIAIGARAPVLVTQNSISDNEAGIVSPVPAPQIMHVGAAGVSGTCATRGSIELFSDAGDQGDLYLGQAPCEGGVFTADLIAPTGRNVTATFTSEAGVTSGFSSPFAVSD